MSELHYHKNERGFAVKCYHSCKNFVLSWQLWLGFTLSFPIEHFIWEKLWPFYLVTKFLGL